MGTRIQSRLVVPTVHGNYSERLWLHAKTILVALENYSGWLGELNRSNSELTCFPQRTLPLSLFCMPPLKRKFNAVSAIADEI